ncbi:MAG: UpxY family transcription antiterminator [Pseudomonadota bacterium]
MSGQHLGEECETPRRLGELSFPEQPCLPRGGQACPAAPTCLQPDVRVPRWYAVHTRSRHEDVVQKRLAGRGVEVFLPKIEVWSRRLDRRKRIQVPLFAGYLFVNVQLGPETWIEIVRTGGVVRVLKGAEGFSPVPTAQIESVQTLLAGGEPFDPHPYPQAGRRVRVLHGPLAGCEGILLRKSAKSRLVIAVDIIRRAVCVEIDSLAVEPA